MRQNELSHALRSVVRTIGPKQRPYVLAAILILIVAYTFLAPALERRFGWQLPELGSESMPAASGRTSEPLPRVRNLPSSRPTKATATSRLPEQNESGEQTILQAFRSKQSNIQVSGIATVKALLPDDKLGDRHQKMILKLPSGHSLLLAHNIDLAERIPAERGDVIEFVGEYEFSEQGGVLHWTHHDPRGSHPDGWIKLGGKTYQ